MSPNKPEVVSLNDAEVEALKKRVAESSLAQSDQKVLLATLSFNFWLQTQLARAQLSILRLKKIFGLPTEKKKPKENDASEEAIASGLLAITPPEQDSGATAPSSQSPTPKKKPRFDPNANHGRYAANDYIGCPLIPIAHDKLKPGDICPACAEVSMHGRLCKEHSPQVVVKLSGSPLITGKRYELETLRCSLCGEYYVASLPKEVSSRSKYDETCRTSIAISRYYSGQPFHRTERLQSSQGVPLADATQWDLVLQLYKIVLPVYDVLESLAANGKLIQYDDTGNRILESYSKDKAVHTTSFISQLGEHAIYLFFTSLHHAGENFELLLEKRVTDEPLITMSDASSQNIPKRLGEDLMARWILCFCLVHGRRKFYELQQFFGKECEFVLDIISEVYRHEGYCKKHQLNPEARLLYHQEHSTPLMEALRVWLNNQLLHHLAEPNSALGQAMSYMLRHWNALTRFLHVAGAPIDNSVCEQAIKVAIRHRRNSLFYKTYHGAKVGDCMMSLIHTAAKNKINIFDYLNALQLHAAEVTATPALWLPWNYQATLAKMIEETTLAA